MAFSLSPSVDVKEFDLSLTIPNLPSAKTGMVLRADTGPGNKIVSIASEADLVNTFGRPTNENYHDWFNAYNFLQYASSLYVVRPLHTGVNGVTDENGTLELTGAWTDLTDPLNPVNHAAASVVGSEVNFYNEDIAEISLGKSFAAAKLRIIERFATSSHDLAVAVCSSAAKWKTNLFKTWGNVATESQVKFADLFDYEPEWTDKEFVLVVLKKNASGRYEIAETHLCSYSPAGRDANGKNIYAESWLLRNSKLVYGQVGTLGGIVETNDLDFDKCTITPTAATVGTIDLSDVQFAQDLFKDPESFDVNLLIAHALDINGMSEIAESRKDAVAIVAPYDTNAFKALVGKTATEASANLIADFGITSDPTTTVFKRFGTYSSLYGNLKYQYDKFNDVNRWVSLAGDVAGLYAQTDNDRDPWWAPAGLERGKVKNAIKLAFNPNKQNRDDLYINSINPIMSIPGEGVAIVYGQKTATAKPSAFDRVNVRRLLITLEKAIATAARYALFEFNDEFTRARLKGMIEPFLRLVKGRRGLYDFLVICDESNNTPEIIDKNGLVIDVFLKPTKVAEFIQINMKVTRTDANFAELVGNAP